jgi:predicted nucleotide-binding protein
MLEESALAILVMTGEDELLDGKVHPRLNVVHEAGLFQGRLGFSRTLILLEEGTEEFSNIQVARSCPLSRFHPSAPQKRPIPFRSGTSSSLDARPAAIRWA